MSTWKILASSKRHIKRKVVHWHCIQIHDLAPEWSKRIGGEATYFQHVQHTLMTWICGCTGIRKRQVAYKFVTACLILYCLNRVGFEQSGESRLVPVGEFNKNCNLYSLDTFIHTWWCTVIVNPIKIKPNQIGYKEFLTGHLTDKWGANTSNPNFFEDLVKTQLISCMVCVHTPMCVYHTYSQVRYKFCRVIYTPLHISHG